MFVYRAPVDEILFSLDHIAKAGQSEDWDVDLAEDILRHFADFAENVLAPLNTVGDAQGAQLIDGRVVMPQGYKEAFQQLADAGWQGLGAPEQFGGQAVSPLIAVGISEIFSGANHAMQMVCNLVPGAIATLMRFGTEQQQQRWIPGLASGEVLSTMCLTEAQAGSDLAAIRCKASLAGGDWHIDGEKLYISGGDQDLSSQILHFVLARSTGVPGELSGLSLFLCPAQPAVQVTRLEAKLGLHASPTCQLMFDQANAELLGTAGAGLQQMFTLMDHARVDVGLQGVAHAAHASRIASDYAAKRVQGKSSCGTSVPLDSHADVRRMLDEQQLLTMTRRAMCHLAALQSQLKPDSALTAFLTSLCKVAGSEAGIRSADIAIQVLGGYGYIDDYGVHQIWRDSRITAIYEGTNGIHTRALLRRGLLKPGGGASAFIKLVEDIGAQHPRVLECLQRWHALAETLATCSDADYHARAFADCSIDLLATAILVRISRQQASSQSSGDQVQLATRKLEDKTETYRHCI